MSTINGNTSVREVVRTCPDARRILDRHGLRGCGGDNGPNESLSFFATVHQVSVDELVREINDEMRNPSAQHYVYKETFDGLIWQVFETPLRHRRRGGGLRGPWGILSGFL